MRHHTNPRSKNRNNAVLTIYVVTDIVSHMTERERERECRIFHFNTSPWANLPMKILHNTSSFWGSFDFILLPDTFASDYFCVGGICGISVLQGTGTSGIGEIGDTSIGTSGDVGTGILNASYVTSNFNSSLSFCVTSSICLGLNRFKCFLHSNLLPLIMYITLLSLFVIILSSLKLFPPQ